MEISIGDIWFALIDYTDKNKEKLRPVVIIEKLDFDDYMYIPLTSNLSRLKESEIILDSKDVEIGKIVKSKALLHKLCVIHKSLLHYKVAKLTHEGLVNLLKSYIFYKTRHYYKNIHKPSQSSDFIPGKSKINYAGRVFDEKEMINLVDSSLEFWLTTGRYLAGMRMNLKRNSLNF